MNHLEVLRACVNSWPDRPKLNPAEWPCTREQLEDRITHYMAQLAEVMKPSES